MDRLGNRQTRNRSGRVREERSAKSAEDLDKEMENYMKLKAALATKHKFKSYTAIKNFKLIEYIIIVSAFVIKEDTVGVANCNIIKCYIGIHLFIKAQYPNCFSLELG
ncbi:hypothetical protein BY458DRAFT_489031 [Sporodiniella umbellata]|nr:hypothetical protein BY458DRAFT_489031 [Sporodiniella umbellata]